MESQFVFQAETQAKNFSLKRLPDVGRHQLPEVGGVRGEDGPVRAQPLGPGHDGDVGEGHPLADALHHVPDVQQDGLFGWRFKRVSQKLSRKDS